MTTVALHPSDLRGPADTRLAWPWITTFLICVSFFLSDHDLYASRHWEKYAKKDMASLVSREANGRADRQVGYLLLGAVGVALAMRHAMARPFHLTSTLAFPVATLLLWAVLSTAWSADRLVTIKRLVILICSLVAVVGLVRQFEMDRLVEITFVVTLVMLLLGIVVEAILWKSNTGEEYRFAGTLHPNHAGINSAFLLLSSLFLAHRRADRRFFLATVLAVGVLLMTKSRTAMFGAITGSTVLIALAWPRRKKIALLLGLASVVAVVAVLVSADQLSNLSQTALMNRKSADPTTLTGRTMIWNFALSQIQFDAGRIAAGFGYGGFWTQSMAQALTQRAHFALSEGHNAYLDLVLQLGFVGIILYLWMIGAALWSALSELRRGDSAPAAFAAALLAFTLVHHFAESAMTVPSFPALVLWSAIGSVALRLPLEPKLEDHH